MATLASPPIEGNAIQRMRRGFAAAAERQRSLLQEEGPRAAQAVAEVLSALEALASEGKWPAPRDPVSERAVEEVRARWVRIQQNARKASAR